MGINLTWVCHRHKRYHTSLRGEEGVDFQYFVREMNGCPSTCLRDGNITVYHDGYFDTEGYTEFFSDWRDTPAEIIKERESILRGD